VIVTCFDQSWYAVVLLDLGITAALGHRSCRGIEIITKTSIILRPGDLFSWYQGLRVLYSGSYY
jgi:hypothetical protein